MSRKLQTAITMDQDLLRRIDAVAEAREESRSAVIERLARNNIGDEEELLQDLANPVMREMLTRLMGSPKLMKIMATVVGEEIGQDKLARMAEAAPHLKSVGIKLAQERKRGRRTAPAKG